MKLQVIMKTARNAVIEILDGGIFNTKSEYELYVNGVFYGKTDRTVCSIYDLKPDSEYVIAVTNHNGFHEEVELRTDYEFVTLNVKEFGAKGDGVQDDTTFIQSAIMACPKDSRIYFPAGKYLVTSLFLKSDIRIELGEGAEISAETDRNKFPKYPGLIESYDETDEYNLGTWEGNPLIMFTGIITGINIENVIIYGRGTVNGNASRENWWYNEKVMRGAFRPRLFFISHCKNITLQGITFTNSPCWNLHPYFSNNLGFYDLSILNPSNSPNTDGLDPESCKDVDIVGVKFSLGDDCIAIKSGKIYMGKKHKTPSENITIRQCLMENGHGAVTVGSEIAGGVKNVVVKDCLFRRTDRGLRIKTRRGRGKDSILDDIKFENIDMDHVMTPFVVNSFYFCDPDGRTEYVQCKDFYPVDDRTPFIKHLSFKNIRCKNCHVAAAFFYGLPEQKIELIEMSNIEVDYTENPEAGVPAMTNGIDPCTKQGIFAHNVKKLILDNVTVNGQDGELYDFEGVEEVIKG